jgi:SulP family sulfate permease
MIFSSFAALNVAHDTALQLLPVLALMVGVLLLLGALLRIADLVQYISRSVVVGYISGAAILIIGNQLRHVLGVEPQPVEGAKTFFTIMRGTLRELPHTQLAPLLVGLGTAALYLALARCFKRLPTFAIALVIACAAVAWLRSRGVAIETFEPYSLADLHPQVPDLASAFSHGYVGKLSGIAFGIAFLAALENSVMSKALAGRTGDQPNLNQDMLALGMANLATSFAGPMPASGSLTRSALNFASRAQTPVSSLVCGAICAAAALALGPAMAHVPMAALAGLVVVVAASLVNLRNLRICLAATRSDASTVAVTFVATLVMPLHVAIFVGIGTAIALYLRKDSRPELVEYVFNEQGDLTERGGQAQRQNPSISIVHVEGALFFGAAELFRTQIQRAFNDPNLRIIILRMKNAHHLDATGVMALEELVRFLRENGRDLIISGAMKDVYRVLKNSGLVEVIGRENIFPGSTANPNIATRNALKRAQEILGTTKADVKIYYDPSRPRE